MAVADIAGVPRSITMERVFKSARSRCFDGILKEKFDIEPSNRVPPVPCAGLSFLRHLIRLPMRAAEGHYSARLSRALDIKLAEAQIHVPSSSLGAANQRTAPTDFD